LTYFNNRSRNSMCISETSPSSGIIRYLKMFSKMLDMNCNSRLNCGEVVPLILPSNNANSSLKNLILSYYIIFKYNQQDATLHNGIYYHKCSTCFRRFLHPSSGAQNCTHCQPTIAVRSRESSTNTRCFVYCFELLMMGRGTAWNI
jgi:hypothetical protein